MACRGDGEAGNSADGGEERARCQGDAQGKPDAGRVSGHADSPGRIQQEEVGNEGKAQAPLHPQVLALTERFSDHGHAVVDHEVTPDRVDAAVR
jgi:hypothetical protein